MALPETFSRYPIEEDLLEELAMYEDKYIEEDSEWELLFNPKAFNNEFKPLTLTEYKLTEEQLRQYAIQLSQIRKKFTERAERAQDAPERAGNINVEKKSRMSIPKSSRAPDMFGRTAKDYREMARYEKYRTSSMKKRHLKTVLADERVEIAQEYHEQLMHMADVAAKHHISEDVAGKICKDYKAGGTEIEKKRRKQEKE